MKPSQDGVCNPVLTFSSLTNKKYCEFIFKNNKSKSIYHNHTQAQTKITMPKKHINKNLNQNFYFITPTIQNWYYIFDRHNRWQIIADSIKFCQKEKGLELYAYVFMLNHLHLIIRSADAAGFLRDFKKFTAKKLIENIRNSEPRILSLFKQEGGYKIWKEDNQPKIIENEKFALQKINYIHNNPIVKGYVTNPAHWKWSSANLNSEIEVMRW